MTPTHDELLRAFLRAHQLGDEYADRLTARIAALSAELPASARAALPELLTKLLAPRKSDPLDATATWGHLQARLLTPANRAASDPAEIRVTSRTASAGRLQRLLGAPDGAAAPRYDDLGLLGRGGRGEVRRMYDHDLGRTLAMKLIGEAFADAAEVRTKFVEEAQLLARLQHPGIVPIYEVGCLVDGRLYFTMQEIHGSDFGAYLEQLGGQPLGDSPTLRRLIDTFQRVCDAVAYAHARGVIHRDLKPANIMLGSEGQVLVVDWGIAKTLDEAAAPHLPTADADTPPRGETRAGTILGTPAYMAPEQLLGQIDRIDARTDVYALGLILHEILTGEPPGGVDATWDTLMLRTLGDVPPLAPVVRGRALPEALIDICQRALRRDPDMRYQSAGALAVAIGDWLEGVRQHEQALGLVEEAAALAASAATVRREAALLRDEATANLQQIPAWASEQIKHPHWQQLHDAEHLENQATQYHLRGEQRLHAALTLAPGLTEAHEALAFRYAAEHADADAHKRADDAARAEFYLRSHTAALPMDSPACEQLMTYLRAEGELSLVVDPPGAEVFVHAYVLRDRRLHESPAGAPQIAPLARHVLPAGSYLLRVVAPGRAEVRYPLEIRRGQSWDSTPPGADECAPLWLPPAGSVRPDEVYVPAGWFRAGGDPAALNALPPCRLWLPGFVIRRAPVTNAEYLEYLNDLATRDEDALQRDLTALHHRDGDGRIVCRDGVALDWPVVFIDWPGARRYCRWLAARDQLPWRLPDELEWEKAARGVDGRLFPWGDWMDPSWCWIRDSSPQTSSLARPSAHPIDRSPYGALGMVGNSMDWCANVFVAPDQFDGRPRVVAPEDPPVTDDDDPAGRVYRGGSWSYAAQLCRPVRRFRHVPSTRVNDLGLRPVRSLGPAT